MGEEQPRLLAVLQSRWHERQPRPPRPDPPRARRVV